MATLDYEEFINRFVVLTTGGTAFRHYLSQYRTDGGQMDHIWGSDDKSQMQSTASVELPAYFTTGSQPVSCWTDNGITHIVMHNTAATYNQMIAIATSCDYSYNPETVGNSLDYLITPKLDTTGLIRGNRVYLTRDRTSGGDNLGLPTEGFKLYYRTSGIDDNAGTWVAVPEGNDLSGIAPSSNIQFAISFKIFGGTCIPTKLYSLVFTYEDNQTDSHYNPSITFSDVANRRFAWRQIEAWGGTAGTPALEININNANTNALVLNDTTLSLIHI